MILAITVFIATTLLCAFISRLVKMFLRIRKTKQYFRYISAPKRNEKSSQLTEMMTKSETRLLRTRMGKQFQKVQHQYDLAEEIKMTQVFIVLGGTLLISWNLSGMLHVSTLSLVIFSLLIELLAVVLILRRRRLNNQLGAEFPKMLDSMASVYQINPDLKQSFLMTEHLIKSKAASKFLHDLNQISQVGVPIIEALEMTARKWLYEPLFFFISAVKLHQSSGGNLSELFRHSADSIRRQQQNKKAMDSVLFQNKISAIIVCSLVPVVLLFSILLSKNYRSVMTSEPTARALVVGAGVWWIVGVVVMWRTLRVRV